jgi:hypothetical protein
MREILEAISSPLELVTGAAMGLLGAMTDLQKGAFILVTAIMAAFAAGSVVTMRFTLPNQVSTNTTQIQENTAAIQQNLIELQILARATGQIQSNQLVMICEQRLAMDPDEDPRVCTNQELQRLRAQIQGAPLLVEPLP